MAHSPGVGIDLKIVPTLHTEKAEGSYTGGAQTRFPGWGPSTGRGPLPTLAPAELPLLLFPQNRQKDPLFGLHQVCPDLEGKWGNVQAALGPSLPICAMG